MAGDSGANPATTHERYVSARTLFAPLKLLVKARLILGYFLTSLPWQLLKQYLREWAKIVFGG
jgi:hypothetical protein